MRKLFKFLLYLICIAGLAFLFVFKRDWVQVNVLNKIEGMYYVYKGDRAYRHHKLSYAIDYYNRGLELYPNHYSAWHNLGNIYVVYEDFYAAADAYEHAIKYNDKYVVARMNLGIIQAEKLGNFDAAIEQYEAIISKKYLPITIPFIYSNKKSSKVNMGLAYYNMGRAYRQKAVYISDGTIDSGLSMPFLLKSAEAYEKAAKILNKNSDVRYNLALDYHLMGDYRNAGMNYCKAIKISPLNYEAHYNMAILLRHMKYYRESIEELEKAALLVSTANQTVNAEYIFGILSEVSHSYVDFRNDPGYLEQCDNDNQSVNEKIFKKKNKKKDKEQDEASYVYINDNGKIAPSSNVDTLMKKNMSECAGYTYFRNEINGY